ncbi:hypothetical protein Hanom_Chr14g01331291 [Helianthus anomalus]
MDHHCIDAENFKYSTHEHFLTKKLILKRLKKLEENPSIRPYMDQTKLIPSIYFVPSFVVKEGGNVF